MKNVILLPLIALVAACGPKPTDEMPAAEISADRVTVERIGVVRDDIAYLNRRGIYIIKDKKTGKEYIGVSGVGISELGTDGESEVER